MYHNIRRFLNKLVMKYSHQIDNFLLGKDMRLNLSRFLFALHSIHRRMSIAGETGEGFFSR